MLPSRDTQRWINKFFKFTISLLHWPWKHTVFRSTPACFRYCIDSSPIHASLKNLLNPSNNQELMKQIESSKNWFESFITVACFNHYKYVLTLRSCIFQYGHRETDLKAPCWAGKWLVPSMQQNSRGAEELNWQPDLKLIHRKTGRAY